MLKNDVAIRLSTEFGDVTSDADLISMFNNWIDETYICICSKFNWLHKKGFFPLVTVADQVSYNLDKNIRRIVTLKDLSKQQEIIFRSYKDLVRDGIDLTTQGQILYFYYKELTGFSAGDDRKLVINLVYVPDGVYNLEIEAEKSATEIISTNEHIPIPSELLPALYAGVRKLSNMHEDMNEQADRWNQEFEMLIADYKLHMEANPADNVKSPQDSDLQYGRNTYMPFLQFPNRIG